MTWALSGLLLIFRVLPVPTAGLRGHRAHGAQANRTPGVQVLGMFDSGTNLLHALVDRNFPADVRVMGGCAQGGFWKHWPPQAFLGDEVNRFMMPGNPVKDSRGALKVIALVRAPLSQMSSWKKAGYNIKQCVRVIHREGRGVTRRSQP